MWKIAVTQTTNLLANNTFTGGWTGQGSAGSNFRYNISRPDLTRPAIYTYTYWGTATTVNKIDISNVSTVSAQIQCDFYNNCTGTATLYILNSSGGTVKSDTKTVTHGNSSNPAAYITPTINTSDLKGEYYIKYYITLQPNVSSHLDDYMFVNYINATV